MGANGDLTPDIAHDPRLALAEEPLASPTAFLEKANGIATGTPGPQPQPLSLVLDAVDGSLKQAVRAAVLEFVKRELA